MRWFDLGAFVLGMDGQLGELFYVVGGEEELRLQLGVEGDAGAGVVEDCLDWVTYRHHSNQ